MKREDLFACLEKASEAFAKQTPAPTMEVEEEDLETCMQEEELAELVASQMGLRLEK